MDFTEKLKRLAAEVNKAKVGQSAGLGPTTISNYVAKGSIPRADIALKLARALSVPVDWLVDDSRDWPPPPQSSLAAAETAALAQELGRRMAPLGTMLLAKIGAARKVDWLAVAMELLKLDHHAELPKHLRDVVELPSQINGLARELRHFDPVSRLDAASAPPELRKAYLPDFEFSLLDLWTWDSNLRGEPGYSQALALGSLWTVPKEWRPPWFEENVKHTKEKAAAELEGRQLPALDLSGLQGPGKPKPRPRQGRK